MGRQGRQRAIAIAGLLPVIIAIVVGVLIGIGGFTFSYAEGLSYFSTDPKACANCHIMQDYYDTWQNSGHRHVAGCVDCHLPHETVPKYISKADNGFFHSMAFTLENFHEPIQIKDRNRRIVQNNCVECHVETVHQMLPATSDEEMVNCIHCHINVGHGPS